MNLQLLEKFRGHKLLHPRFSFAADRICLHVRHLPETPLLFVAGAPGAGKSCLQRTVADRLQRLPNQSGGVISVRAIADESGRAPWMTLYHDLERQLRNPRLGPTLSDFGISGGAYGQAARHRSQEMIREHVVSALSEREILAVLIDEAQHLLAGAGRALELQINVLKSICDRSRRKVDGEGVRFVLFGPYTLLDCASISGQLARRGQVIHMPPYFVDHTAPRDTKSDNQHFLDVVASFESLLPFEGRSQLYRHSELLMEGCAGCVGTLHDWLVRATLYALDDDSDRIGLDHLVEAAPTTKQVATIMTEIEKGLESLGLVETDSAQQEFPFVKALKAARKKSTGIAAPAPADGQNGKPRKQRPGKQNPKRLPTGHEEAPVSQPEDAETDDRAGPARSATGESAPEAAPLKAPSKRKGCRKPKLGDPANQEPKDE